MKTILHNAKVYVEKGCYKQAVLIEDGVIRKVGADEEILAAADELTQVIDCEGKTLIPGLNDSHLHFMQTGEVMNQAKIDGVTSIEEMIQICREFARYSSGSSKKGTSRHRMESGPFRRQRSYARQTRSG